MKQNKSVKFWTFLWVARYKRSWRSVAFTVSSSMVRIKNFIPGKNCISSANKVRLMHCKITWFWYTAFDGPAYPKIELVHRNKRKCLTVVIFCHMIIYSFDLEEACTINSQLLRITFDVRVLHITVERFDVYNSATKICRSVIIRRTISELWESLYVKAMRTVLVYRAITKYVTLTNTVVYKI